MSEGIPLIELKRSLDPEIEVISSEAHEPNKGVTRKRFLVIFCVALLNFSNAAQWIAFAPVGNYVNAFYGEGTAPWFSLIFLIITIPTAFIGMWVGSSSGLRFSFMMAAFFNLIGSSIRALSSSFETWRYNFQAALTGQAITALAYPFIMYLPSKTAADWFPSDERTTATAVGLLANPLGVLTVNLLVPYLVKSSMQVQHLNLTLFFICLLTSFIVCIAIRSNRPACYPAISAEKPLSFLESIKLCMTNWTYVLLLLALGGGIGMFNCLYTMMQEMMCPSGYGNHIAGYCAIAMIVLGIFGSILGGVFVDKYPEHCKLVLIFAMSFAVIFGLSFLQLTRFSGFPWLIGIVGSLFGLFGIAIYPIGLEMASETTYPATPETASGLIVLTGQILSVIFVAIIKMLAEPLSIEEIELGEQKCRLNVEDAINVPKDYTKSILVVSAIAIFLPILMSFIRPKNGRLELEKIRRSTLYPNGKPKKAIVVEQDLYEIYEETSFVVTEQVQQDQENVQQEPEQVQEEQEQEQVQVEPEREEQEEPVQQEHEQKEQEQEEQEQEEPVQQEHEQEAVQQKQEQEQQEPVQEQVQEEHGKVQKEQEQVDNNQA